MMKNYVTRIANVSLLMVLCAVSMYAQTSLAVIKLTNKSALQLTVKLVGSTPKAARLNAGANRTLRVQSGDYYLFYRYYDADEKKYKYLRTELFSLKAGEAIEAEADSKPTDNGPYAYFLPAYKRRVWLLESDFIKPPGWPAEDVKVESDPSFTTLKVLVAIGELYIDAENRPYVAREIKAFFGRRIPRDILLPLRQQGFKPTYAGAVDADKLPKTVSDPTLIITYEESEGAKMNIGFGLNIGVRLSLYGAGGDTDNPVWEDELGGATDYRLRVDLMNMNGSLRANALKDLTQNLNEYHLDLSQWKLKN